jgi:electron transfer flavoprotein alpha/beta subunit
MKIIVCLKEVIDPELNLDFGLTNNVIFKQGLSKKLNPNDAKALSMALEIKSMDGTAEITTISIGAEGVESYLRNSLALGADKSIRIWDNDFESLSPYQKAALLAKAIEINGVDLVLTGVKSLDTGNEQVGPMIAARLGWHCVMDVVNIEANENSTTLLKDIGRGEREKLSCPLPTVITIKGERKLPYASLERYIDSKYSEITLLTPADLAISPDELKKAPSRVTRLIQPRPSPVKAPSLDSSLPAFYRILQLLEGGIAKRKGQMLEGTPDEVAEKLYHLFLEEGVLQRAAGKDT